MKSQLNPKPTFFGIFTYLRVFECMITVHNYIDYRLRVGSECASLGSIGFGISLMRPNTTKHSHTLGRGSFGLDEQETH